MAEAIDPSQLPSEYGGTAPTLADTPFLPAVHRALERDASGTVAAAASAAGVQLTGEEQSGVDVLSDRAVAARSMTSLLRCFSLGCNGDYDHSNGNGNTGARYEGDGDGGSYSKAGGGHGGGGGPSGGYGAEICSGEEADKNSGRPFSADAVSLDGDGTDSSSAAPESMPNEAMLKAGVVGGKHDDDELEKKEECGGASTCVPVGTPLPTAAALRATDGRSITTIGEAKEGNRDGGGDLEWVLNVVPGARLVATIAGTATSATLGATLGAAGFAAGFVEAVVPEQIWAEAVQTFQVSQFMARWAFGL